MRRGFAAAVLAVSAVLLFARLGHHALWDDEAGTALTALGVLETGDTSAVVGRNVFAYAGGAELEGLRLRYMPPLQAYLAAPALAAFGRSSAFAARLPFAACALACVALMLWWLRGAGAEERIAFASALLSCASFFLFGRNARYYAPVMLCATALAYLYARRTGSGRRLAALAGASIVLLALNYLCWAAAWACLAVDYAVWGRRERPLRGGDWAVLLVPQAAAAALLLSAWTPFGKSVIASAGFRPADALVSAWYAVRDLHRCQFLSLPLLGAGVLLYRRTRDPWLLRLPLAALVYVAAIALLAPLPSSGPRVAQVRYFVPLIPLGFAAAVLCVRAAPARSRRLALLLTLAALVPHARTTARFVGELADVPSDPYRAASDWIGANVPEGGSVWVEPGHMTYPLMFHAPKAVYAWQLAWPPRPQFAGLPEIHFRGRVPPDYVVVFGPAEAAIARDLNAWGGAAGARYERAAVLDVYWRDVHRPELFWRRFDAATGYDREREAVYVLQRVQSPRANRL